MIGTVVRIDDNTLSATRGRFAKLAICIDLRKPLVSKIRINEHLQKVQYESLPNICFNCDLHGHGTNDRNKVNASSPMEENTVPKAKTTNKEVSELQKQVEEEQYGCWMLVDRRQRHSGKVTGTKIIDQHNDGSNGSKFTALGVNYAKFAEIDLNMAGKSAMDSGNINMSAKGKLPQSNVSLLRKRPRICVDN